MAITRRYATKRECCQCWLHEDFDNVSDYWFVDNPAAEITYEGLTDYEDVGNDDEIGEFGYTHQPMWSTWFNPNNTADSIWIDENKKKIAELGFTIITVTIDGCEDTFLGIDGAGFDFYEAYWIPLYELRGFQWHE